MRDGNGGVIQSEKDYFKDIDKRWKRMFGNQINSFDVEHGFPKENVSGSKSKYPELVCNYKPQAYEIPQDSMFTSDDVYILSYLDLSSTVRPDYVDVDSMGLTKEDKDELRPIFEKGNKYKKIDTFSIISSGFFASNEYRVMGNAFGADMQKAHDNTRERVQKNDLDAIAKSVRDGLDTVRKIIDWSNGSTLTYGIYGYMNYHTCEKTLEMLERNPQLKEKVNLSKEDWEYYNGMGMYAKLIREGEAAIGKIADDKALTPEEAQLAADYKNFQYLLGYDINKVVKEVDENLKDDIFNKIQGKIPKYQDSDTIMKLNQSAPKALAGTATYVFKRSDKFKQLGKCTNFTDARKKMGEIAKEVEKLNKEKDNEIWNDVIKKVDDKLSTIHPSSDEKIKIEENTKEYAEMKAKIENELDITFGLRPALDKYVKLLNTEEYDKSRHRNASHSEFQAMKQSVIELQKYLSNENNQIDPNLRDKYIDNMRNKAAAYLKIKDANSKHARTHKNKKNYASNRYNIALDIFTSGYSNSLQSLASDIRKYVISKATVGERKEWSDLSGDVQEKAVEFVLASKGMDQKMLSAYNKNDLNLKDFANSLDGDFKDIMTTLCTAKRSKAKDKELLGYLDKSIEAIKKSNLANGKYDTKVHQKDRTNMQVKKKSDIKTME